ncbi:TadE-like protein [Methyloligella halotolerans]|uniref:TadE-like protein n=1 Tax=Methyloligella halotolerans TaxID=1177755 RepID=A0A1E2RVY9_9HYPH|nr:TadE/TadG family type IV pilus assembly protein [Methyloligella halotolerans]ODA66381.1 TadE-like protein [Methyloligella halotolerans]
MLRGLKRTVGTCRCKVDTVLREVRGTAAIEFALIVPLMFALYVGAAEIGNTLTASRRTDQVAYSAADLVAQAKTVSRNDLKDITEAAGSILAPYSTDALNIVLTSVVADSRNRPKVVWSCGYNGGKARGTGDNFALPTGLTTNGSSVIVAEVEYAYTPLLGIQDTFKPFTMTRTFYTRPRRSAEVVKSDNGC